MVDISREVSLGEFELRRLSEKVKSCNIGTFEDLGQAKDSLKKKLPSLLQEGASLLNSLSKLILSGSIEKTEIVDSVVSLHVGRLREMLLDLSRISLDSVFFSIEKQQEYGNRICEKVEGLSNTLSNSVEEYDMAHEESIATIAALVDTFERMVSDELETIQNTKEAIQRALEDYQKACEGSQKGKISTFMGIPLHKEASKTFRRKLRDSSYTVILGTPKEIFEDTYQVSGSLRMGESEETFTAEIQSFYSSLNFRSVSSPHKYDGIVAEILKDFFNDYIYAKDIGILKEREGD